MCTYDIIIDDMLVIVANIDFHINKHGLFVNQFYC